MVKKSQTPAGTVPHHDGLGQGAWVGLSEFEADVGRWVEPRFRCCKFQFLVEPLGFFSLAGAVKAAVLIWKLAQMNILTIRVRIQCRKLES